MFTNDFSEEVWRSVYKYYSDDNVCDTWKRVAKAIASVEENPSYWEEQFYSVLHDFHLMPGGRISANAGTSYQGTSLINCFVGPKYSYDIDSLDGILTVLRDQAKTLKSEGGWGMNFSFIRPRGAFIKGIGVESPGAVKYMELFDKSSDIITSGSGQEHTNTNNKRKNKIRKGAMMALLSCWHPDVLEFITSKQQQGRLAKFNISVGCTNKFMDLLIDVLNGKAEDKWDLVFPITDFEKYKEEWDGNIEKWISKGYPYKIYNTVKATYLWELIMQSTYNRNDPGVLFLDRANETYCWNYGGDEAWIDATNPCQPAWAHLLTKDGIKKLKDVNIGDYIWSKDGWVEVTNKWCTGVSDVYQYMTEHGVFYGTVNHRIVSNDEKIEVQNAKSIDVLPLPEIPLEKTSSKIISILFMGTEEVFDITVNGCSHTYWSGNHDICNCGEQALPPGHTCNLLSLNLTKFINKDRTDFDYKKLSEYTKVAVRFADNVNSYSNAPLPQYVKALREKRRIGLGIMGWGSALYILKVRFGSDIAAKLQDKVMECITHNAVDMAVDLAEEKGMFVGCDPIAHTEHKFWKQINLPQSTLDKMLVNGIRCSALFSVQPTGHSSVKANLVSGGLEPVFMHSYIRTVIVNECPKELVDIVPKYWEGDHNQNEYFKSSKEGNDDILIYKHTDGTVYKIDRNRGLTKEVLCEDYGVHELKRLGEWDDKADWVATTENLTVEEHVRDMSGFAKWIDSSISKTVNIPNDYPYTNFKNLYLDAYKSGVLKGITTYRAGTMTNVLAKESSIKTQSDAKKRPKSLNCDIHRTKIKGKPHSVLVGILDDAPYEIMVIPINIPREKASIVKVKRGHYDLIDDEGKLLLDNITEYQSDNEDALTRMISTSLRHKINNSFLTHQLEKVNGSDLQGFAKSISRVLKKYIKDGSKVSGETCPSCNSENLIRQEGCIQCASCSYSKCS